MESDRERGWKTRAASDNERVLHVQHTSAYPNIHIPTCVHTIIPTYQHSYLHKRIRAPVHACIHAYYTHAVRAGRRGWQGGAQSPWFRVGCEALRARLTVTFKSHTPISLSLSLSIYIYIYIYCVPCARGRRSHSSAWADDLTDGCGHVPVAASLQV